MGIPYVTEAVARAISSDVAEQKITSANIPEIEANPTLEGGEDALTALEVNGTKYTVSGGSGGSEVVANPELEGDEDSLTGLEVDGTKYKVGGSSTSRPREIICIQDLFGDFKTDYASTDPYGYYLKFNKEAIDSIGELLLEKSQNENPPTGVHLVGEDMYLGNCIPLEDPDSTSDFISYTAVDETGEGLEITTTNIFGDVPVVEDGYYKVTATGVLSCVVLDLACTCDLLYAELEASEPTLTLTSVIKDSEIIQLVSQLEIEVEAIPGE